MRGFQSLILAAALLASSPSPAQDTRPQPRQGDQATDNVMPATPSDAHALSWLLAIDEHGLAAGELARLKNPHQPTADYAKQLVDEHEANHHRTEEVLGAIGARRDDEADDIQAFVDAKTAGREALDDLEGDEFTMAFLRAMEADHAAALAAIDSRLMRESHNDDVTAHLRVARSRYATHLDRARALIDDPDR